MLIPNFVRNQKPYGITIDCGSSVDGNSRFKNRSLSLRKLTQYLRTKLSYATTRPSHDISFDLSVEDPGNKVHSHVEVE
jgi:hypothetical protein